MLLDFSISENRYEFTADTQSAESAAKIELTEITTQLEENGTILKRITTDCDKTDYILPTCSGAICGVMDIFFVGAPVESPLGNITDRWFENRTKDFAKLCGWNNKSNDSVSSAIRFLEKIQNSL